VFCNNWSFWKILKKTSCQNYKSVGIQHKKANDLKSHEQIADEFGGKIPGNE